MEGNKIVSLADQHMDGSIEHLREGLHSLRAGRASSVMIEGISVEVYGSQMRIRDLATITVPETRQVVIMPFDVNNASAIAKAIEKANLGLRSSLEGKMVRVFFPELDEERRKDLVKQVRKLEEEGKISVRNARREANESIKQLKSDGHIPEDDVKRHEKKIQDLTDAHCKRIEEICKQKEEEIMTV